MKLLFKNIIITFIIFYLASFATSSNQENQNSYMNSNEIIIQIRDSKTGYGIPAEIEIAKLNNSTQSYNFSSNKFGKIILKLPIGLYKYKVRSEKYKTIENYLQIPWDKKLEIQIWLDPNILPPEISNEVLSKSISSNYVYIYGYVVDKENFQPIANVKITSQKHKIEAYTNERGFFSFHLLCSIDNITDSPEIDNLIFSKEDYITNIMENIFIIPEQAQSYIIELEHGKDIKRINDLHKILQKECIGRELERCQSQIDIPAIMKNPILNEQPVSFPLAYFPPGRSYLIPEPPIYLLVWDPPDSIRVGTNCSCTVCSSVDVVSLETYVERGLNDEWIASWATHSLRSGAIPYRSYGTYYIYNPINANYDICSSTCCQVYDTDTSSSTVAAADYTAGILLQRNNNIFRAEYSAENNNYNCSDSGCSNSDCSCGNGYAGSPATSWSCISDSVCSGTTCYGHGRGMCQWGTQRWAANQSQLWKWIVNHYYNNNGSPSGLRSAYMTSPIDILSASPNPSTVPPGQSFTINLSAYNYAEKAHNQIMIGASLYSSSTGYIDDPSNDKKVSLIQGNNNVSRLFAVPSSTPDGTYDLVVALWFDIDENNQITGTDLSLILKTYNGVVTVQSCTSPSSFNLLYPSNGSSWIWIQPTLDWEDSLNATSYLVEVALDPDFNNIVRSTNVSQSTWQITPALDYCRTYYWRITAQNECGSISSIVWSFTTDWQLANYDAIYKAPLCPKTRCCGPGTLIDSRNNIAVKSEINYPNTINSSCPDGSSGSYHVNESVDSILIRTVDDTDIEPNKQVNLYIYAWCSNTNDYLDIYYSDTINPLNWSLLATYQCNVTNATKQFIHNFVLSPTQGYHTIRANYRSGGFASPCTIGDYNDHDDLIITVCNSAPSQATNPNPPNGSSTCSSPILSWTTSQGATHYDVYCNGNLICSNITTPTCQTSYSSGAHNWFVISKNACGNTLGPTWSFSIDNTPPANIANTLTISKNYPYIILDWEDSLDAAYYNIYRSENPSLPFPSDWLLLNQPNESNYSDPSLINANNYYYIVLAADACGNQSQYIINY